MSKVLLLLGSNLGDRDSWLAFGRQRIESAFGLIVRATTIHETEPWGYESKNGYLNQVVEVETSVAPLTMLHWIEGIERSAGRQRAGDGYADRTLDIDILYIDDQQIDHPKLTVPHPRIGERPFVQQLLAELDLRG